MQTLTVRLRPGEDLYEAIQAIVARQAIQAGCVLTCAGSLTQATIRLADREEHTRYTGRFEIVSLSGTLSVNGSHLHVSISDGEGRTIGGHLTPGCLVYTTAEIVLGIFPDIVYRREHCEQSGYEELVVYPADAKPALPARRSGSAG